MEDSQQRRIIEALILASPDPVSVQRLTGIVAGLTPAVVKDRIKELNTEYETNGRAFEIWEVAGGFQIRTRAEFSGYVQQLRKDRPLRLSQAALESLAIVAYKQPLTRAELEIVRGVDSGAVLRSLLDRRLLRLLGHREVPGRPLIYGTGKRFLEVFGLESLKELPSLRELEELAREQGVELASSETQAEGEGSESGEGVEASEAVSVEAAEENAPDVDPAESEAEPASAEIEAAGTDPLDGASTLEESEVLEADDADDAHDEALLKSDDGPAEPVAQVANRPSTSSPAKRGSAPPVAPE